MSQSTRGELARIARKMSEHPFHGFVDGEPSNLEPIIRPFPGWNVKEADQLWCAAFVYFCCVETGFVIPHRPNECVSCNLAGCLAWEEWATRDARIGYYRINEDGLFVPQAGDIVLYDRVFSGVEHDHIGIVLENRDDKILVAEGNLPHENRSGIIERPIDDHIRAFIRIPDGYVY